MGITLDKCVRCCKDKIDFDHNDEAEKYGVLEEGDREYGYFCKNCWIDLCVYITEAARKDRVFTALNSVSEAYRKTVIEQEMKKRGIESQRFADDGTPICPVCNNKMRKVKEFEYSCPCNPKMILGVMKPNKKLDKMIEKTHKKMGEYDADKLAKKLREESNKEWKV